MTAIRRDYREPADPGGIGEPEAPNRDESPVYDRTRVDLLDAGAIAAETVPQ